MPKWAFEFALCTDAEHCKGAKKKRSRSAAQRAFLLLGAETHDSETDVDAHDPALESMGMQPTYLYPTGNYPGRS